MCRAFLFLALGLVSARNDTCGWECTIDADCSSCGTSGKCSIVDKDYAAISSSCVDAPANPPASPAPSVDDSVWPNQFTCDVESHVYSDFGHTANTAKGKFFYDGVGARSRSEWKPFTNGKDATQVWIPSFDKTKKSKYYVKSGPLCLYFPIHDVDGVAPVNQITPTWIKDTDKLGLVKYMGRELVDGEWADHYAATYKTEEVVKGKPRNQTIIFANWHSLGLGKTAKGLPLRLSGGNINPSSQGQPRLMGTFYSNFTVGPNSVKDEDFKAPTSPLGLPCIPLGMEEVAAFAGVEKVTPAHVGDQAFIERLHYMPHAKPITADLQRARTKVPRADKTGPNFEKAMVQLNKVLARDLELSSKHCEAFSVAELHEIQKVIFNARSPALQDIYKGHDNRALAYASLPELMANQKDQMAASEDPGLTAMVRDGLCHEVVMTYAHHLTESARQELKSGSLVVPRLPEQTMHSAPKDQSTVALKAHKEYAKQVSCAVCHVPTKSMEVLV